MSPSEDSERVFEGTCDRAGVVPDEVVELFRRQCLGGKGHIGG
jgi:hypothetical protein